MWLTAHPTDLRNFSSNYFPSPAKPFKLNLRYARVHCPVMLVLPEVLLALCHQRLRAQTLPGSPAGTATRHSDVRACKERPAKTHSSPELTVLSSNLMTSISALQDAFEDFIFQMIFDLASFTL